VDSADGAIGSAALEDAGPTQTVEASESRGGVSTIGGLAVEPRLQAMIQAGRYHGVELDPNEFRRPAGESAASAAALAQWAQNAGMWARGMRIRWRHLLRFQGNRAGGATVRGR
jgi:ATP-binding cassette, subfamily B, bacterial HlyB/CyaB